MRGGHPAAYAAAAAAVLVACTGAPSTSPAGTPPAPPAARTTPSPDADQRPPTSAQPLLAVVHATRPPPRLSAERARAVRAGRLTSWRLVDGSPGTIRLVDTVREVERDPAAIAFVPAGSLRPTVRAAVVDGVDPIRRPAAYPLRVPGPAPPTPTVVRVVGDIMLGRRVALASAGSADPVWPLRHLRRLLVSADVTVGNLESTTSAAGPPQQGGDSFVAPPGVVDGLGAAGFDAVSLANNHTGDFGRRSLLDTVAAFARSRVRAFGAGRDLAAAGRAVVVERNGVLFGILGFNSIGETPRATPSSHGALSLRMPPRTGPLAASDLAHVSALIRALDRRVDVVLVLPHWGAQYTHEAVPAQRRVGRRLVEAGADLVVGGHPHWVQGLDRHRSAVIAHSLGNFVFDMDFMVQTRQGIVLEATFWGPRLISVDLVPYVIGPDFAPRPATTREAAEILADVWAHSTGPFQRRR